MNDDTILVVACANIDLVAVTEKYPLLGETVLGREFEIFPGGEKLIKQWPVQNLDKIYKEIKG